MRRLTIEEEKMWDQFTKGMRVIPGKDQLRPAVPEKRKAYVREPEFPDMSMHMPARRDSFPSMKAPLFSGQTGLDGSWERRIRQGRIQPETVLDLHGLDRHDAYQRLAHFLTQALRRKLRLVLVITGKGKSTDSHRQNGSGGVQNGSGGVLKENFITWLETLALRDMIAAIRQAHACHGGKGAFYVVLKRERI